jgi:hypothetical protein
VRLEHVVRLIDWSRSSVVVETEKGKYEGDLLVLAVPGPLTTDIGWNPPLPAKLRAQLETALANYWGPVTHCPPAPQPEREELDIDDDEPECEPADAPSF